MTRGRRSRAKWATWRESGYLGNSQAYSIKNGSIVTTLADTPFEVTVYKLGDKYFAARSNEFGYANYEMLPKAPVNLLDLGKDVHVPPEAEHGAM